MTGSEIPANYDTHPRQMLREAARLFASLGNDVVFAATATAMYVDRYFEAVLAYNQRPAGRDGAERWRTVQTRREQVGRNLDETSMRIPGDLRWGYQDGTDYSFRRLCTMPPALAEQIGGPTTGHQQDEG